MSDGVYCSEPVIDDFEEFDSGKFLVYLEGPKRLRLYALRGAEKDGDVADHYRLFEEVNGTGPEEVMDSLLVNPEPEKPARRELKDIILGGGSLSVDHEKRQIRASGESEHGSLPNDIVTGCLVFLGYEVDADMAPIRGWETRREIFDFYQRHGFC
ncbi:MAG: hypothetical protein ACE5FW_02510 [Candidatus Aenigmatarchaeota archaeon]